MKNNRSFFSFALIIAMAFCMITGCKKEPEETTIRFTMIAEAPENVELLLAGTGKVIIYWGDGTSKKGTLKSDEATSFTHSYFGSKTRTIKITDATIFTLNCERNKLSSLVVGNNPKLEYLSCYRNQLTSLDVSDCPALGMLYCYNNQLTANALNDLFESLHSNEIIVTEGNITHGKRIFISGNPGTKDCNESIATNKGWGVSGY
jgi:hypothetical protein